MTEKLSTAERDAHLAPLLGNGWSLEAERDAITKTFKFKNFIDDFSMVLQSRHFMLPSHFTLGFKPLIKNSLGKR